MHARSVGCHMPASRMNRPPNPRSVQPTQHCLTLTRRPVCTQCRVRSIQLTGRQQKIRWKTSIANTTVAATMNAMLRCLHCNREFKSERGLTNHRRSPRNQACLTANHQMLGLGLSQSDSLWVSLTLTVAMLTAGDQGDKVLLSTAGLGSKQQALEVLL